MDNLNWLEEPILMYIKNNQHKNLDSVDIVHHFKLRVDIIMKVLGNLENQNKILRENYSGINYRYVISN